tara:strand:- start:19573 stop:21225 length:1653 start_codon:yes stop_codon:yes gene_type:complete
MFKQQSVGDFIPLKSVEIKPEAQVPYDPINQTQARFVFPQYLGFISPAESRLQFDIQMTGRGRPIPNPRAGCHSLFRDFRIQSYGLSQKTLEECQDYNVLTSQWWGYTENDSISHKRTMWEGKSIDPEIGDSIYYGGDLNWATGLKTVALNSKKLQIQMPLYSGLLGGDKVLPVVALQGITLQLSLDNLSRSLVYQTGGLGINNSTEINIDGCALKVALNIGDHAKQAIGSEFLISIKSAAGGGPIGFSVNRNCLPYNNNPFDIGDVLYAQSGADMEVLGIISGFRPDGDGDLAIVIIPNRPVAGGLTKAHGEDSAIYVLNNDRVNGIIVGDVPQDQIDMAAVKVTYSITDLEYIVGVVSPPTGYIKSMMAQINGAKGLAMDYKAYSTYRENLGAINGLTNQNIPANQTRAYSILSVPLAQNHQLLLNMDSFQGQTDGCRNYQYVYGPNLVPDRPIELIRYLNGRTDALHLIELEKALTNCGYGIRNLQRIPERFLIGRAWSKYGQVSNLSKYNLSLRVEYIGAVNQKMFNHYICHLKRFIVKQGDIEVY